MNELILILGIIFSLILLGHIASIGEKNIFLLKKIVAIESRIALPLVVCMWIYHSFITGIWISRDNYLFMYLILMLITVLLSFLNGLSYRRALLRYKNSSVNRGYGGHCRYDVSYRTSFVYVLYLVMIAVITITSGAYLIYGN